MNMSEQSQWGGGLGAHTGTYVTTSCDLSLGRNIKHIASLFLKRKEKKMDMTTELTAFLFSRDIYSLECFVLPMFEWYCFNVISISWQLELNLKKKCHLVSEYKMRDPPLPHSWRK